MNELIDSAAKLLPASINVGNEPVVSALMRCSVVVGGSATNCDTSTLCGCACESEFTRALGQCTHFSQLTNHTEAIVIGSFFTGITVPLNEVIAQRIDDEHDCAIESGE